MAKTGRPKALLELTSEESEQLSGVAYGSDDRRRPRCTSSAASGFVGGRLLDARVLLRARLNE